MFVYGTLRRQFRNIYARRLAEEATWLGIVSVPGRLYRLGSYPGMRAHADPAHTVHDRVIGELYRLPPAARGADLLAELDQYEGSGFERTVVIAQRAGRPAIKTWVYAVSYTHLTLPTNREV